jgi:hypothetical protein
LRLELLRFRWRRNFKLYFGFRDRYERRFFYCFRWRDGQRFGFNYCFFLPVPDLVDLRAVFGFSSPRSVSDCSVFLAVEDFRAGFTGSEIGSASLVTDAELGS